MCLLIVAWQVDPEHPLIALANRDELYARPSAGADFWDDAPELLGGRDLERMGTWLGVTRSGRFAAVTNVREPGVAQPDGTSRGDLVRSYLLGQQTLSEMESERDAYAGFNLLAAAADELGYVSNRAPARMALGPGIYGVSNHVLDTPWPKVRRGKEALAERIAARRLAPEELLDLLAETAVPPDDELPDTGIGLLGERQVAPVFVRSERYGTRASTVVLRSAAGRVTFLERSFSTDGKAEDERRFQFEMTPSG